MTDGNYEWCPHCTCVTLSPKCTGNLRELAHAVQACAHGGAGGGGMPDTLYFNKAKVRAALIRLSAAVALLLREVEEGPIGG